MRVGTVFHKNKGLIYTVLYYLIGLFISYIIYLIYGWEYIHAPGYHHMTFILFLFGGVFWSLVNIIQIAKTKKRIHKQSLLIHGLIIGGIVSVLITTVKLSNIENHELNTNKDNSFATISKQDSSIIIVEKNDTIYWKIKDSVLIDKMKIK